MFNQANDIVLIAWKGWKENIVYMYMYTLINNRCIK